MSSFVAPHNRSSHIYLTPSPFIAYRSANLLSVVYHRHRPPGSCIGGGPAFAAFADDDYAVAAGAIRHSAMPSYAPSFAPSKVPTSRHRMRTGVDGSEASAPVATLHGTKSLSSDGYPHSRYIYPPWARRLTASALPFSDSSLERWDSRMDYYLGEEEGVGAVTVLDRVVSFLSPYAWAPPKRSRRQLQAVDTSTFG